MSSGIPIGTVLKLWQEPCANDPFIYAETLPLAAMMAVTSFYEPNWKTTVHMATGKSWLKHAAQEMREAEIADNPIAARGQRWLWQGALLADTASWWYFLASLATETLVNWTTLVHRAEQCDITRRPYCASSHTPLQSYVIGSGWQLGPAWSVWQTGPNIQHASAVYVHPRRSASIIAHAKYVDGGNNQVPMWSRIRRTDTDEVLDECLVDPSHPRDLQNSIVRVIGSPKHDAGYWMQFEVCSPPDTFGRYVLADSGLIFVYNPP